MHSIIKAFGSFHIRGKDGILENKGLFRNIRFEQWDRERTAAGTRQAEDALEVGPHGRAFRGGLNQMWPHSSSARNSDANSSSFRDAASR